MTGAGPAEGGSSPRSRRVLVVGSANVDVVFGVERIAAPGETVLARGHARHPGGKGANQAVAAARLGADVAMIARVGDDEDGSYLRASLDGAGVDTKGVTTARRPTGVAFVQVDAAGQNSIVVSSGANAELAAADALAAMALAPAVVLMQLEVPVETVKAVASSGRLVGSAVVLNLAPAQPLSPADLVGVTHLVVNEHEAGVLLGRSPSEVAAAPADAARALTGFAPSAFVTLGANGAVWATERHGHGAQPAFEVDVVDTTAAGDAFVGALAARLAAGEADIGTAVRFASAAGALAATREGAQPSLPDYAEVVSLLTRGERRPGW